MKPIDRLIQQADGILEGKGEVTEDWHDALELYRAASKMESGEAHSRLGDFYKGNLHSKSNLEKAIFHYKQAVRLNYIPAAASLANLYTNVCEKLNSSKLWEYYFSNAYKESIDKFRLNLTLYIMSSFDKEIEFVMYENIKEEFYSTCIFIRDELTNVINEIDQNIKLTYVDYSRNLTEGVTDDLSRGQFGVG